MPPQLATLGSRHTITQPHHHTTTTTSKQVAGNFHIAFGDSIVKDGRHIHQFIPSEAPFFNVSHKIHHVSFGDEYPGRINPLDGKVRRMVSVLRLGVR